MKNAAALFDVSAIALSGLCLLHCLALPGISTMKLRSILMQLHGMSRR